MMPMATTNAIAPATIVRVDHGSRCWITMYPMATAGTMSAADIRACAINSHRGRRSSSACRRTYSATSKGPAGTAGRIYPGNFDLENEKNITGITSHRIRNTLSASPVSNKALRSAHQARTTSTIASRHKRDPRYQRQSRDRKVEPKRLRVMVEITPKPREIVLEDEDAEELGIAQLHRDVPRRSHRQKYKHSGQPQCLEDQLRLAGGQRKQNR